MGGAYTEPGATLYPRMVQKGPYTIESPGYEKVKGQTLPRRNARCKDGLITQPAPEVKTLYDIINFAANKYGNAQAIGTRKLLDTHSETKKIKKVVDGKEEEVDKKWTYFELSGYTNMTFLEFQKRVSTFGAALNHLGMTKADKLHLYGATSMNWYTTAHGSFTRSITVVTAYETLGEDGLSGSLEETKSRAIFLDSGLLPTFNRILAKVTSLEFVIYNDEIKTSQAELDKIKSIKPNMKVISVSELQKLGESNPTEHVAPDADDVACIMYTSGTSGTPKGVTLKHKAIVAAIAGVSAIVQPVIHPGDRLLAYLPSAHILEFIFENASFVWGTLVGYGNSKTLTDASVRNCKGDLAEFKPTIMVGVPAVWESVRKGVMAKVAQGSFIQQKLFWGAYALKQTLLYRGLPGVDLLDSIVFNKVRAATGGQIRICMSGGSAIAKETQKFISMTIAPLLSGYGLTETSAMGVLCDPQHWTVDALGDLPACIDVKLVDFADANYLTTNNPPQGEIWVKGISNMTQYYNNLEETKVALTDDGWMMTGDIGEFNKDGHLTIIDRKKNLIKTLNGEYIALEKLESLYRSAPVVANICVYAAEDKAKPIAIIVPAEPALNKLAKDNGIDGSGLEQLAHNPKMNDLVLKELLKIAKEYRLSGIETLDGVVLSDFEWTPQNNFVTAAQKIQRKRIFEKYKKDIEKAYGGK